MFLGQSSSAIFMRLLIKFIILTYAMLQKNLNSFGLKIWASYIQESPFVSTRFDADPKRDNWALIKKREEKINQL